MRINEKKKSFLLIKFVFFLFDKITKEVPAPVNAPEALRLCPVLIPGKLGKIRPLRCKQG